jgi:mRNA-degrading endonuclease HigB of HigAB toxin-antitoxin module
LIAKIVFHAPPDFGRVLVKRLLTHEEYDRGAWKGDC